MKSTLMYGMLAEIETAVYEPEIKRLGPKVRRMVESSYSICTIRCAQNVAEWLTENGIEGDVHFLFESGRQYAGEAANVGCPGDAGRERVGRIAPRENDGILVAVLFQAGAISGEARG
jgi:hypothetical protein